MGVRLRPGGPPPGEPARPAAAPAGAAGPSRLDPGDPAGERLRAIAGAVAAERLAAGPHDPGVSVVTCSRNRSENLLRAIPSWLARPEVTEVVVVDWTSDRPVARDLAAAGLTDPRLRVVRVEDEERWILSLAFNLGFRLARCTLVLKADADIVLSPDFFARNPLPQGRFVAGNWRRAAAGQTHVNGFFFIRAADLAAVNGFNEFITTYGWDDDDLYDRLAAAGIARTDVVGDTITHLPHEDVVRLNADPQGLPSGWADLARRPLYSTRTNRLLAAIMPVWNRDRTLQPFALRDAGDDPAEVALERAGAAPNHVPPEQRAIAERLAAQEMLSWQVGQRAHELTGRQLDLLLSCCTFDAISPLQVELMLSGAGLAAVAAPRHLVVDLTADLMAEGPAALASLVPRMKEMARHGGRVLVFRMPGDAVPAADTLPPALAGMPLLPLACRIGPAAAVALEAAARDHATPVLRVTPAAADFSLAPHRGPARPAASPAAPMLALPAHRLFIDVQHGLGNRLRAMGSAQAVAEATGRELVLVWQPDDHCRARFGDLFVWDGAVEEVGFARRAAADGATVVTCMENEPGCAKDAPLALDPGRDAYVRSAYVLNHPASTWDRENRLLRNLVPSPEVAALVARVPDRCDIGLHVRMEGGAGTGGRSYDDPANWTAESHAEIVRWRDRSHFSRFMARLDALLAAEPAATAFLAADLPETYRAFEQTYGSRVRRLDRAAFDRSAAQAQHALADLLLLARCHHLLGSNWSSFTEAALRLSSSIARHERAGIDF